ncbi:MAG: transposase, partial [Deltaproteobacteria bacterium]|nr:transposase [Deltaproteobacteria bacterium]
MDYKINEILELYYNRQTIEQVFDTGKNYCGLLPVRVHSEETFRGILLISFIASVIYSFIS